jgi:hypothetical protein
LDKPSSGDGARVRIALQRWLLVAITAAGFALRAYRLAAQSLWSDEDITLDRAGQPLAELFAGLPIEHAPLYFAHARVWALLAGDGDLALRYPSLVFGVLAIPLGAYVGRRLVGNAAGLILAVLLAVSPFLVWYGQEARMYTLVSALSLCAVASVLRAEQTGWRGWWVLAGASASLCVYTHYYGVLLVAALAAWALLDVSLHRRAAIANWLLAGVTGLVVFAPWLPRAARLGEFPGWRDPEPLATVVWTAVSSWSAGSTAAPQTAVWATILYLILAALGIIVLVTRSARGPRRRGSLRLLLYLAVPLAIVALLVLRRPDFHPRYFFAALPAAYSLVKIVNMRSGAMTELTDAERDGELARRSAAFPQVWAAEDGAAIGDVVAWLDAHAYPVDQQSVQHLSLARYFYAGPDAAGGAAGGAVGGAAGAPAEDDTATSPSEPSAPAAPVLAGLPVTVTARVPATVDAGSVLPVALYWHPEEADAATISGGEMKVAVRLVGPQGSGGSEIARADRRPVNWTRPTSSWNPGEVILDRHGLLVPADAAPGPYFVFVVLYLEDDPTTSWTAEIPAPVTVQQAPQP